MNAYPKARWSVSEASVGASVWLREVPEGSGGGYYLYTWERGAETIRLEELVAGTTKDERAQGERSVYVLLDEIPVPADLHARTMEGQELHAAVLIFDALTSRFGQMNSWIPYGNDGKTVWFHEKVTG